MLRHGDSEPPMLLLQGLRDAVVAPNNARSLAAALLPFTLDGVMLSLARELAGVAVDSEAESGPALFRENIL